MFRPHSRFLDRLLDSPNAMAISTALGVGFGLYISNCFRGMLIGGVSETTTLCSIILPMIKLLGPGYRVAMGTYTPEQKRFAGKVMQTGASVVVNFGLAGAMFAYALQKSDVNQAAPFIIIAGIGGLSGNFFATDYIRSSARLKAALAKPACIMLAPPRL